MDELAFTMEMLEQDLVMEVGNTNKGRELLTISAKRNGPEVARSMGKVIGLAALAHLHPAKKEYYVNRIKEFDNDPESNKEMRNLKNASKRLGKQPDEFISKFTVARHVLDHGGKAAYQAVKDELKKKSSK